MASFAADALRALSQVVESVLAACGSNAAALALAAAFVETLAGLGVVIPGGTAVILAGFAARTAGANGFLDVAIAAAAGMTLGATVDYWLGRLAGPRLVPRWAPWRLSSRWRHLLRRSHGFMRRWGWWALIAANLAGPGRASVAIAAGASRWPFLTFLWGQMLASLVWASLFVGLGYFTAGESQRVEAVVSGTGAVMGGMLALVLLGPYLARKLAFPLARAFAALRPPAMQATPAEATVIPPSLPRAERTTVA